MDIPVQRQTLSAGLYIVAVPIGNLKDMTLRALETLSSCQRILCEDTRTTQQLLSHYGIEASLYIYNDHSAERDRNKIAGWLAAGESVALVSDAGTPLISDPGFKLVRHLQQEGFYVTTLPGPSALTAALTLAGLPTDKVFFLGFLPPKSAARQKNLSHYQLPEGVTYVAYERGSRIGDLAKDVSLVFGDTELVIVREITKHYEEVLRLKSSEIPEDFETLGECVVLFHPERKVYDESEITTLLQDFLAQMDKKEAIKQVAEKVGLPKNQIYKMALDLAQKE